MRTHHLICSLLLLSLVSNLLVACSDDDPLCPAPTSGTVSIVCLPDTLTAPWELRLPGGLVARGAGDSVMTGMADGAYTIRWGYQFFFNTPEPDTLTMTNGGPLEIRGDYLRPERPTGTIDIDVSPEDAAWSIAGSSWFATHGVGDATLTDVPVAYYDLAFGPYAGYFTPNSFRIYLDEGDSLKVTVAYEEEPTLVFPGSPGQLMQNVRTIYETRHAEAYPDLMHPDFLTFLQPETTAEFPDVGSTLDFNEEWRIHARMFSGQAVTDPNGYLVPGITSIRINRFQQADAWAVAPPDDLFPGAEWAPFDIDIDFDRGQEFSILRPTGMIKFYVTSRDSFHEGVDRKYYQMLGQVDLTTGQKGVESISWGTVKALFR